MKRIGYVMRLIKMTVLAMAGTVLLAQGTDAEARSLASIAAGSAARRIARPAFAVAGARAVAGKRLAVTATRAGKPVDVIVRRGRYPEAAAHIEHAQRAGQPTVLTLDRAGAARRRADSLRYIKRKESSPIGKDRDEYPPAMTREGGFNSNVRYIGASDNRGAGKSMEQQIRGVPVGARVRMLVAD